MRNVVYMITNTANGKRYIGITGRAFPRRWNEHLKHAKNGLQGRLYRAIRKYGKESFQMSILAKCETREEVLLEEIKLIELMKPEYNIARGGGGRLGVGLSPEGCAAIIAKNTGNKYRLGKKLTDESKSLIRRAQFRPDIIEAWDRRRELGPKAYAKPVICLSDGLEYPSIKAAAEHYNVAKTALNELCRGKRGRKTVGGMSFKYMEVKNASP